MSILLDAVSARIGDAPVVDGVSAEARDGEVTGLLGPNGAGKSTLLRVIAGIARPASGRVFLDGEPIDTMERRVAARRIALLEQSAELAGDLRVLDVVVLGRFPHRRGLFGSFDGPDDQAIALAALEQVGVAAFADRSWNALSGGERQRVHIARALAQEPEVLLLDEPTNHLDVSAQLTTLAQVRALGLTAVVALHDLNLAAAYCDRLLLLDRGALAAYGTPSDVLTPQVIRSVYGAESRVLTHPRHGGPLVVYDMPGAAGYPLADAPVASDDATDFPSAGSARPAVVDAIPAANPSA